MLLISKTKRHRKIIGLVLALTLVFAGTVTAGAVTAGAAETEANQGGTGQSAVPVKSPDQEIKVDIHHVLVESANDNSLQLREVLKINNTSKNVYEGNKDTGDGSKAVLNISLPAGYTNLVVTGISQESVIQNPDNVITTSPLKPGITQVSLSYNLPFTGGDVDFAKVINYPTEILYFLSPKELLKIKGDKNILDYGIQSLEGKEYHVFLVDQGRPGQQFNLYIYPDRLGQGYNGAKSGFHSNSHLQRWAGSPLRNTDPHMWVGVIIVLFFAAVAAGGYYLKKKRQQQKARETEERLARMLDDLVIRQKRLLTKIDSLDRQNGKGEISPEDFNSLRKQYMDKLVKIKLKIKELEELEEAGSDAF